MKMRYKVLAILFVLALITTSCIPSSAQEQNQVLPAECSSSDLTIVSDSNAKLFLEDQPDGTKGLLTRFKETSGLNVCVLYTSGPEAVELKTSLLPKAAKDFKPGDIKAFVFDSNIYADGLSDQTYVGNTNVGIWIRQSSATRIGLDKGTPLTMDQYGRLMEKGELKIVTAPAYSSTASSIMFFQTLSAYFGSNNQLTPEQVLDEGAQQFGHKIYDHYVRSATSTENAIKMVLDDKSEMYDGVVGFESTFLGKSGLNAGQSDPFVFFYFDPSVVSTITLGRLTLDGKNLENYNKFASFLTSEESQIYIASTGIRPQKDVVDLDPSVFRPEWGLLTSPSIAFASPPTYPIAQKALAIYRDYYKRAKVVKVCVDVSPSMFDKTMKVNVKGDEVEITRIQALNRALLQKITNSAWLKENQIVPGKNDIFDYYFFSSVTTGLVAETKGTETDAAGTRIDSILGPWSDDNPQVMSSDHPQGWNPSTVLNNLLNNFGLQPESTAMFDCSNSALEMIKEDFNTETDYYIVILTDGNNMIGLSSYDFYNQWNSFEGKTSVTVIGIAFGTDGSSVNQEYTRKFGGNTYMGGNDAELVTAFKQIINR